jgi:hypothetical protein
MRALRSFETSGITHPTTQRRILENLNPQQHSVRNSNLSLIQMVCLETNARDDIFLVLKQHTIRTKTEVEIRFSAFLLSV